MSWLSVLQVLTTLISADELKGQQHIRWNTFPRLDTVYWVMATIIGATILIEALNHSLPRAPCVIYCKEVTEFQRATRRPIYFASRFFRHACSYNSNDIL